MSLTTNNIGFIGAGNMATALISGLIESGYDNKKIYSCKPPQVKIQNENGAGDTMIAFFNYFINNLGFKESLVKSMIGGSLQVANYKTSKKSYLIKIDKIYKKIKINTKYI